MRTFGTLLLKILNINKVTDASFVHLKGIHTLDMTWCNQLTITDATLVNLRSGAFTNF